jgi:hypothetical protein
MFSPHLPQGLLLLLPLLLQASCLGRTSLALNSSSW